MPEYRSATFVVRYDANICIHAASCVRDLPAVFNVNRTPWVNVSGADAETIRLQVSRCPSGALSFQKVAEPASV